MMTAAALKQEYQQIDERAAEHCAGLDDAQLRWQTHPTRWSMIDCIGHLSRVGRPYLTRMQAAFDSTDERVPLGDLRASPFAAMFARNMEPPYRVKMKTARDYAPQVSGTPSEALAEFHAIQRDFLALIDRMDREGVPPKRIASPVTALLRFRMHDWLRFLAAHARRHLWQAGRVRDDASFPVGGA